jgi:mono/diheme cytochrome c family protein
VFDELGCASCHGAQLGGTRTAPPLADLDSHWQTDSLVSYLQNPAEVARATPHIAYRNERYPLQMPSFGHVDEAKLRQLVEFLMTR